MPPLVPKFSRVRAGTDWAAARRADHHDEQRHAVEGRGPSTVQQPDLVRRRWLHHLLDHRRRPIAEGVAVPVQPGGDRLSSVRPAAPTWRICITVIVARHSGAR